MSDVVERLLLKAEKSSSILRGMAEDKSRRQPDNPTGECVYFWPEPHQTLEGEAAAEITRLRAQVASLTAAVEGERERCARVAEGQAWSDDHVRQCEREGDDRATFYNDGCHDAAAAIREGG